MHPHGVRLPACARPDPPGHVGAPPPSLPAAGPGRVCAFFRRGRPRPRSTGSTASRRLSREAPYIPALISGPLATDPGVRGPGRRGASPVLGPAREGLFLLLVVVVFPSTSKYSFRRPPRCPAASRPRTHDCRPRKAAWPDAAPIGQLQGETKNLQSFIFHNSRVFPKVLFILSRLAPLKPGADC